MSVSGVSGPSSTSGLYQPIPQSDASQSGASQKDVRDSFKQVADAIQSGDVEGAQNAFDSLAQLLGEDPDSSASSTDSSDGNYSALLGQIGDSLQSGDLQGAQQGLQGLQQAMRGHHHRHHGAGSATSQGDAASGASTTDAATGDATTGDAAAGDAAGDSSAAAPAPSMLTGVDLTV